jgi:hypothetical protein
MCYVGWLGHIETSDSVLTRILRRLGAVFYGFVPPISPLTLSENDCPPKLDVWRDSQ